MRPLLVLSTIALLSFAPDSRADTASDLAEKVVTVMERAATIAVMNRSNCDSMGDKLTKLYDDNQALLDQAKAENEKLTPDQRSALQQRYAARTRAAIQKMMAPVMGCRSNAKVAAVIMRAQT